MLVKQTSFFPVKVFGEILDPNAAQFFPGVQSIGQRGTTAPPHDTRDYHSPGIHRFWVQ